MTMDPTLIEELLPPSSSESWDKVARDLKENSGIAVVDLDSKKLKSIPRQAFEATRHALQRPQDFPSIPETADAAHATGYHAADSSNSLSRYNQYREGFVFSDGQRILGIPDFEMATIQLEDLLHTIAERVLNALERQLELPDGWFQESVGPTRSSSQWHLKNYVMPEKNESSSSSEPVHLLPSHTDPSLISIIIHDRPGKQQGSQGLRYSKKLSDGAREWTEVPFSGHGAAVVFVGSVLSQITGSHYPACRHCVTQQQAESGSRMAATLFVRPVGTARLQVPPSRLLKGVSLKREVTFDEWNARVARNYMRAKAVTKHQSQSVKSLEKDKETTLEGYYRDEWTELCLIPCDPPLTGKEKYLGGELGGNGMIYTIPGHATRVLKIDPTQDPPTVRPIGPSFAGEYKWLRGVRMSTGIIVAIPCHASSLLCIDPSTDKVFTIEWDTNDPLAPPAEMEWKWHGGQISPIDGCLYCVPQRAETILKFDPVTEKVSFFGGPFPGRNKWYGGLVGEADGAIYGINQNAAGILRIDPATQTATIHGDFGQGGFKWHGGVVGPDGNIYGIPAHADSVLKIAPGPEPELVTFGGPLQSGAHRSDGKYKYLGGAVGKDEMIYFFPSDSDYVLQINPQTEQCRQVGPNLRDAEPIHHNKWQNGVTFQDGSIYGIPLKSTSILRIRTFADGSDPDVKTIGGPFDGLNKWEGAVMSADERLFCMPLNNAKVLQISKVHGS